MTDKTFTDKDIAWLEDEHGENPQEIGKEDGTEDDFGDLLNDVADVLGIPYDGAEGSRWQRMQEYGARSEATTMLEFVTDVESATRARA